MNFEVEQKHRVVDSVALQRRLADRGVTLGPSIEQLDDYFNHPARDFGHTDEALRIRTMHGTSVVTYKGPRIDATTKTRHELELPLAAGRLEFAELLAALGFQRVLTVRKFRRPFELDHSGQCIHGAWDEVDGAGTFVELELMADAAGLEEAKRIIASLAEELQLGPSVRRSYLELLLSNRP